MTKPNLKSTELNTETKSLTAKPLSRDSGWPLVWSGAVIVTLVSALNISSNRGPWTPLALPVTIPTIIIGRIAVFVPAILFVCYNIFILGFRMTNVTSIGLIISGMITFLVSIFSTYGYAAGWKYRDVYIDGGIVDSWVTANVFLAGTTFTLLVFAFKRRTPNYYIAVHISIFVWFFSFAFPWIGESI